MGAACSRSRAAAAEPPKTPLLEAYNGLPDDMKMIVLEYVRPAFTNAKLRAAVKHWFIDKARTERRHGKIGTWDVGRVTDMHALFSFEGREKFNDPGIAAWDTSSVDNMMGIFNGCYSFNVDIGAWDTSSVTCLSYAFADCVVFNKDIGSWDTSISSVDVTGFHRLDVAPHEGA